LPGAGGAGIVAGVNALTEAELRASFINCSKGEAKRLPVPRDLSERPWDDLDLLGWHDLGSPERAYLVAEPQGRPVGVVLRAASGRSASGRSDRPGLCAFCLTPQPGGGVRLMTAPRAGAAGKQGNSVGTYVCADLACSLYVRGRKKPAGATRLSENLTVEEKIERLRSNLSAFLGTVAG
jgi:FBP C-terminal treble-clef zinc-finger